MDKSSTESVAGFSQLMLMRGYEDAQPIPDLHKSMWDAGLSGARHIAFAAPRKHAKSTAITFAYMLYLMLFRIRKYGVIISSSEETAAELLGLLKLELKENEALRDLFGIARFEKSLNTDIIVAMKDGYKFRILAKGAGQKIRGRLWNKTRPDIVIGDDMEDDEAVDNPDRRRKFKNWFLKAVVPILSSNGQIFVVGTILHLDSLLYNLVRSPHWTGRIYKAHTSFDDFSNILWPEAWPEEKLRAERQMYIDLGQPEAYSQEYLNDPSDRADNFFRRDDFLESTKEDLEKPMEYYVGVDFAISDRTRADYTVLAVVGIDSENFMHVVDIRRGRWEADIIIEEMFSVYERWKPNLYVFEHGAISRAITPALEAEMDRRGVYFGVDTQVPTTDKRMRARPLQQRMRTGHVKFDKSTEWYPALEEEMIQFPSGAKKDQVDALAWVAAVLNKIVGGLSIEEEARREIEEMEEFYMYADPENSGMNTMAGY